MNRIGPLSLGLALILPGSRLAAQAPGDSSVFRGSLEGRPGLVFLALHPEMTVAYDGKTGDLFQAWKGPALRSGEIARMPGIPYRAQGPVYHRQGISALWTVRDGKSALAVKPEFIGVFPMEGHPILRTRIKLPRGRKITVTENPGFDDHYGDNALRRNFSITGIPAGFTVTLLLSGEGMPEVWGGGGAGRLEKSPEGKWILVQSQDGETPLKVTWSGPKTEPAKNPFQQPGD